LEVGFHSTGGQLQLPGHGAHRLTVFQDHQDNGGVGGRDATTLGGLVDGLNSHVDCVRPPAHRLGIGVRENQTDGRGFLIQLDVRGVLGEPTGVSQFDKTKGVGNGGSRNPFFLIGAFSEPSQCE
jgi:hypothetical protein